PRSISCCAPAPRSPRAVASPPAASAAPCLHRAAARRLAYARNPCKIACEKRLSRIAAAFRRQSSQPDGKSFSERRRRTRPARPDGEETDETAETDDRGRIDRAAARIACHGGRRGAPDVGALGGQRGHG